MPSVCLDPRSTISAQKPIHQKIFSELKPSEGWEAVRGKQRLHWSQSQSLLGASELLLQVEGGLRCSLV